MHSIRCNSGRSICARLRAKFRHGTHKPRTPVARRDARIIEREYMDTVKFVQWPALHAGIEL
jgi:hypothetical protein